jgi:hypothetical protein
MSIVLPSATLEIAAMATSGISSACETSSIGSGGARLKQIRGGDDPRQAAREPQDDVGDSTVHGVLLKVGFFCVPQRM